MNAYGDRFRFTIWGQSHGPAIGVTMEGLPAGFAIDFESGVRLKERQWRLSPSQRHVLRRGSNGRLCFGLRRRRKLAFSSSPLDQI